MNASDIKRRVREVSGELEKKGIDCLIITKPANVSYATGFLGDDSWAMIIKGRSYLLTDSRYTEQAINECPICAIIERHESLAQAAAKIIKKYKYAKNIAVENSAALADFKQIKKAVNSRIKTSGGIIENTRSIKDESEIAAIKTAGSIAARGLELTLPEIKPGMTESEAAGLLDFQIRRLGAVNSFETIMAFGPNASKPHHKPGERKLKKNDTILIDFGAKYAGYCSDITRCFIVGKSNRFYRKVYDVVEKAQIAAIQMVKAGITLKQVDSAARDVIKKANLPVYGHGTGHGVGIEIHENPFLRPEAEGVLQRGQIITIEPGIYMPGRLGVRIEDDILVTETGCETLTRNCPHSPDTLC